MRFEELHNESFQPPSPNSGEEPDGGVADNLRQAGEDLFRAADDAINRALAGNSQAFLEATRQSGGQ
jgi:hypothetical protein